MNLSNMQKNQYGETLLWQVGHFFAQSCCWVEESSLNVLFIINMCLNSQTSKWTAVSSPPALHWSTLEQFGFLPHWAVSSCFDLMAQSTASTTKWLSVCLATTRTSCWERLANTTSWTRLFEFMSVPTLIFHCCFDINRVSLSWCLVSMDGCLTQTERPALSLIHKEMLVKVQPHPKYQGNMVSVWTYLWCALDSCVSQPISCD